jgi:hypothetical protein
MSIVAIGTCIKQNGPWILLPGLGMVAGFSNGGARGNFARNVNKPPGLIITCTVSTPGGHLVDRMRDERETRVPPKDFSRALLQGIRRHYSSLHTYCTGNR